MEQEKKTSRQLQAEKTKAKLFEAALSLLKETDFEKIRIQDIVSRAGVSVGAFYNYYQSKLEVYYQTYEIGDTYFENQIAPKLTQESTVEKLKCYFKEYIIYNSVVTDFKLTKLLYNSDNKFFNRDHSYGMLRILTKIISEGMERGELTSNVAPTELADYLIISIRGLVYSWCTMDGEYDIIKRSENFVEYLINGCLRK